jgi:hypothetical protein
MIIVKLKGGLGNQFFQYAVARQLAEIHNAKVKIDVSFFETYDLHAYSIAPFNIQENIALTHEVAALRVQKRRFLSRAVNRLLRKSPGPSPSYIREKHFHFDPDILKLPDNVYLDGYWQSEKYFKGISRIIRQEFRVKTPQANKDKEIAECGIAHSESVSLHIRRGSYVLPPYNSYHGTCPLEYYLGSVEYIAQRVREPHFFVFSDDPTWARDHLSLAHPITLVEHNGADKDFQDLRLMSQCKHHIIANSTFSWWGAWLSENPQKIVIAPRKWFNEAPLDTRDLIPSSWIQI